MSYAIGIDLGGTNIKAAAVSESGERRRTLTAPTDDDRTPAWVARVRRLIDEMETAMGGPADRIGLAAPGLAARDARSITWMQGRLDGLQDLDWTDALALGRPVPVINDGHAALLAEAWVGAAAGARDAVLLTLGTGVGGAAIVDGRLLKGHLGRAGHFGHLSLDPDGAPDIVGTPGSLEEAIGDCTITVRTSGRFSSTKELVAAHRAGDLEATAWWMLSVHRLAVGIAGIINAVDPEVVILGGGITRAGDALFDPLRDFLEPVEWRPTGETVRIVPAALGDLAGAIGAARQAIDLGGGARP